MTFNIECKPKAGNIPIFIVITMHVKYLQYVLELTDCLCQKSLSIGGYKDSLHIYDWPLDHVTKGLVQYAKVGLCVVVKK